MNRKSFLKTLAVIPFMGAIPMIKAATSQENPLSFVQAFMDKQERANFLKVANYHRELAEEETDRMESVQEQMARIVGISPKEVI